MFEQHEKNPFGPGPLSTSGSAWQSNLEGFRLLRRWLMWRFGKHAAFPNGARIIYVRTKSFVAFHACIFLCCFLQVLNSFSLPVRKFARVLSIDSRVLWRLTCGRKKYDITHASRCSRAILSEILLGKDFAYCAIRENAAFPNGGRMTYERVVSCIFLSS